MAGALTRTRLVLWVAVGLFAVIAAGLYVVSTTGRPAVAGGLGTGDYRLSTATGETFTHDTLKGHPSMVFFGFTHCPDVCPTTLSEMVVWYRELGAAADRLDAYFVTVDPERDTAEVIGDYVAWTGRVTGVTGPRAEIDKAIRSWGVYAKKVPLGGDQYNMDHTASVFLVGADGQFEGTISYREETATALGKLRKLLGV